MPVDRQNSNILRCAACGYAWQRRKSGTLPQACPRAKCRSTLWFDGVDHRKHVQDDDLGQIREAASRFAFKGIRDAQYSA